MISKAKVQKLIDKVEICYRECWDMLYQLRISAINSESKKQFNFQFELAHSLFELDELYRSLHQERKQLIDRKENLNKDWFNNRMRLIQVYQDSLKQTIAIGKMLGDAFAWVFYSQDRELLKQHFKHENNFHTPPGIGGRGELEFVKRFPMLQDWLVIYHQITTFLRIGDISLYNLKENRLQALGELKTKETEKGHFEISVSVLGPTSRFAKKPIFSTSEKSGSIDDLVSPELPQYLQEKLGRQLRKMAESFNIRDADESSATLGEVHYDNLTELLRAMTKSDIAYQKVGDGLLLIGIKNSKNQLSKRLMDPTADFNKKFSNLPEQVSKIVNPEYSNNTVTVHPWHSPSERYHLPAGMTPLLWWPIDLKLLEKFVFQELHIIAIYNSAHLIRKLQNVGLQVEHNLETNEFLIFKKVEGGYTTRLENFKYFISLIVRQLHSEKNVVDLVTRLISTSEQKVLSSEFKEPSQIQLYVEEHF